MCSEYSARTATDLSSSHPHDECKQTFLRRINSVESRDNILCVTQKPAGCFQEKQNKKKLMGMWLIADSHHQRRATAAVTSVIRILVSGWRSQNALREYLMTLVRFVQISKHCDWYACVMTGGLNAKLYCLYERQALWSIVSNRKRSLLQRHQAEYQFL